MKEKYKFLSEKLISFQELFEELLRDIQDEEKDLFMNEVKERIRDIKGSFSE